MYEWEKFLDNCIREIAKESIVLDIGSGHPFKKEMEKYKGLFENPNCSYYSVDLCNAYGPNIIGNIHSLPFQSESVDAIICKAVLEHVPEPTIAINELYRVLRRGGKLFVYLPFLFPYHGNEFYKDYYRFTKDAVEYMFRKFETIRPVPVRGYCGVINLFIPFTPKTSAVAHFLDRFISRKFPTVTSGWNVFAVK
ncbi:methyltransferase domain-containing protein [Chloroflexota bacterium]